MSKQLAISASLSVLAMAAFALASAHAPAPREVAMQTGATVETAAPAFTQAG